MASSTKPEAKQLGEFLKQQQEPFILDIYLSERGCLKKKKLSTSKAKYSSSIGCHGLITSGKLLKKNLKVVLIFNRLFPVKGLKTQNSDDENGKVSSVCVTEMKRNDQEPYRFSTASSTTTVYHSCSDTDIDEPFKLCNQRENKAVADSKFQWSSIEDSKQDSPQSMLEDMLSTSFWKFLLQTRPGLRQLQKTSDGSNSSPFSKRIVQQTKKVPYEKIKDLLKSYGDESSSTMKLLELDANDSTKEWNDYEQHKKDIGLVIAEEIITEVIMDMIFNVF